MINNDIIQDGIQFDPFDWYWIKKDGTIYSSKVDSMVDMSNDSYKLFIKSGAKPTPYPKNAQGNECWFALMAVLKPYGLGSINVLDNKLKALDAEYLTPRMLSEPGSDFFNQQKAAHEQKAEPLRKIRRALLAQNT